MRRASGVERPHVPLIDQIQQKTLAFVTWIEDRVIAPEVLLQIIAVGIAFILAVVARRALSPLMRRLRAHFPTVDRIVPYLAVLAFPFLWLLFTAAAQSLFEAFAQPAFLLRLVASLLVAWLLIRAISRFIRNREMARLFAIIAWVVAALHISGLFNPVLALLDAAAITIGSTRISLLNITTALITFAILIWLSLFLSRLVEQSIARMPTLSPSAQVLLGKLVKISLITLAVLFAITSTGIDLTALAVVGGAVGLGLGFGLQKVISNLISGVILLMDRSIKPGDVIELGESYGWINKLAARYTSVITRDGREHLIPNEDVITQTVINWTYSNTEVRRGIPIRVSYATDVRKAMALILEAARETRRVLADPEPQVLLKKFGEYALELELRIWIADPHNGVANVASDVLLLVWDKFQANGIHVPYPQQDLHLLTATPFDPARVREILAEIRDMAPPPAPSPDGGQGPEKSAG